jgi:GAF domain-containing protein
MKLALQERRAISGRAGPAATLSIPLKVREQVIGVIDAHKPEGTGNWTEEEAALLQTLVDQLAVALDSARLYQDTQRRAVQDRVISQVTTRIRESLDVRRVLETATDELYESLGLDKVIIRLAPGEDGSSR